MRPAGHWAGLVKRERKGGGIENGNTDSVDNYKSLLGLGGAQAAACLGSSSGSVYLLKM